MWACIVLLQQAEAGAVAAADPEEPNSAGDSLPTLQLRSHNRSGFPT